MSTVVADARFVDGAEEMSALGAVKLKELASLLFGEKAEKYQLYQRSNGVATTLEP